MKDTTLTPSTIVTTSPEVVSANMEGQQVILNLATGIYFGLDEVGTRIWSLIEQSRSMSGILESLLAEYNVDKIQCQNDLVCLINKMHQAKLIEVQNA